MMTLTLIQLSVFALYVGMVIRNFGVLPSISESWYEWPQDKNMYFTFFTWGLGIPMMLYGSLWFFISGAGLVFVGTATRFKSKIVSTDKIHYMGAIVGIFSALIGIWRELDNVSPLLLFILGSVVIQTSNMKNKLWWIEILAFMIIMLGLFRCHHI